MPEAVIVATGRTPIGRAFKGSLVDMRPDDLTALVVRAVLAKVPELDPHERRGPHGRLRPAGRRVGLQRGPRRGACSPGSTTSPASRSTATARRRCRPSAWPPTPSGPARATSSSPPASRPCRASPAGASDSGKAINPLFADAMARTAQRAERVAEPWTAAPGPARHLHRHGPDRRERGRVREGLARGDGRVRRAQPGARRRPPGRTASSSARSSRSPCPTAPWCHATTVRAPARPSRSLSTLQPVFREGGTSPPATPVRSTTAPPPSS